ARLRADGRQAPAEGRLTLRAIDEWHDLLTPALAADSAVWLDARQRERGLAFGARPLCTVLRPRFLDPASYDVLRRMSAGVLSALHTAGEAVLVDAELRKAFHLAEW